MRRVVLAGCGHAHLEVVRSARAFQANGAQLVLIDPGKFWYSGRASGLLGGRFKAEDVTIDPRRLAAACGAEFIAEKVVGLDREGRRAILSSGRSVDYDFVSFNVGSRVRRPDGLVAHGGGSVKPIASLPVLREEIAAARGAQSIVVVGGGATGCELVGNLLHLQRSRMLNLQVTLLTTSAELLMETPPRLRAAALRSLTRRGATVLLGTRLETVAGNRLRTGSGETIQFDPLILATGLEADPMIAALGLPTGERGLRVTPMLQALGDPSVFAAGDCAAIEGYELPKIGVYGVRAGPVLLRNLLAAIAGRPLEAYRPQKHYLSILDLADGEGLATRAGFSAGGRMALRLKNHLDQRFLDRYRRVYEAG